MKKKLLFFILLSILFSCASKQRQADDDYHASIFLNSDKNYSLTSGYGNNSLDAKIDSKGQYVYYSRELNGNTDIFVVDTYSLKTYRLTRSPAIDSSVSIDDKSDYLVFSSTRDDAYGDIFLYKLTKYGIRKSYDNLDELENGAIRLTKNRGYDITPSISKDGSLIAFISDREGTNQLYTMRSYDGANVVKRSNLRAKNPKFSFNGKMIVFETLDIGSSYSQIACLDLVTGITAVLTDTPTMKFNPTFYNDDIIIYFEIKEDSDNDGELSYSDKRSLVSYSLSEGETYILDDDTSLISFDVPTQSSDFAVFINQVNSTGIVSLSSTKQYFIKDYDVSRMYNTFSAMDLNKKLENIDTFARYFPNSNSMNTLALAYFDLMYESYTNNSLELFSKFRDAITNKYIETQIYSNVISLYDVLNGINEYTNIYDDERYNYIIASVLLQTNNIEKNYLAFTILEESLKSTNIKNKEVYKQIVNIYNKSLNKNDVQYINTHLYNAPYERNDILTFSDKLQLAKDSVRSYGFVYEGIIKEFSPYDIISVATRLIYLDNLLIGGNSEYALSLFTNYLNSPNNNLRAIGNYAIGRIYLADKNESAYSSFRDALKIGSSSFADTYEANYSRDILNKYYRDIADSAYQKNQYSVAYESYKNVLEYNPNDSTASYRIVESSLKSLSDIEELEKVIKSREKAVIKNKYTDDIAHSELALTYYYLASRYYQKAITLETSQNRYILRDRKREDGFYYYLNKSFNSIIDKASFYIDFAIFLNPSNPSYYIKKAEMLGFASALKMRVMQDDKTYKSLVELLPSYSEDNEKLKKVDGYYNIAFKTTDIEAKIISALEEARLLLSKSNEDVNISIMLANAYLINGRYEDAKNEYEKYSKIADKQLSKKALAWYHFFYGYSLWVGNDINAALQEYNKSSILFNSLGDTESLYKVIGYSAVASIEQRNYKSAIAYLQEKANMIEKYKYEDDLNNLLLALCYLQIKDYNKALEYCDKAREYIDKLDYKDFYPRYIKLSFLGSSINVVNLGLASFGGYIPGEPLNVDKKQMLYSLYQELYESLARYPQSRDSLTLYKNYILEDAPKKDIKLLMLATYYNNEGYLYYKQGDKNNALKSFKQSIEEFKNSINPIELKDNPYAIYKNAQNDIKNYLSISSIYLDLLTSSTNILDKDVATIIKELKEIDNSLNILSTNVYISAKDKIILNSHIAARDYIYATKLSSFTNNSTSMDEHNFNIRKLSLLKDAIDKYKYILDARNNLPLDLKTEIIIRYNLGLCYEATGNTELASKEYVASYMKASNSSFIVEEIGILTKLMDFSKNYRKLYSENIDTEDKYARRILKLLEDSVFMIVFSPDNQILRNARGMLLEYFNTNDPKSSVDVITLFSSIELRRAFLSERLSPFTGRNSFTLKNYYNQYEKALLAYQNYQEAVLKDYNKNKEMQYLKDIKTIEAEVKKELSPTAIAPIGIGLFNSKYLQNIIRPDETLIIDSGNLRFAIEKNKIYPLNITNIITNTKNYITYIGSANINVIETNTNMFVRYIRNISEYIVPKPTVLVDTTLYSSLREIRRAGIPRASISSNTNLTDTNTLLSTNRTRQFRTGDSTNIRPVRITNNTNINNFKYTTIESITNIAYMPVFVDLSDVNTETLNKIKNINYYGVYVNKQTFDNNIRLINSLNTIFLIVGSSNNISRVHFINNYLGKMDEEPIENIMAGYDRNLYKVYGKTDTTIAELKNSIVLFKTTMSNIYKSRDITSTNDPFMSTLIKYSQNDNERINNYRMFIDDYTAKNRTNITYYNSYLGFNLIKNDVSNTITEDNSYRFMKSMLSAYRRNRNEEDIISNANRMLFYASKYTNMADDLMNEQFTENNLSLFLRVSKNTKEAANILDTIVSYIDNTNKNRILTLAYFYHSLYAKSDNEKLEYYLNQIYTNRIITNYTTTNIRRELEGYYAVDETITITNVITNFTMAEDIANTINSRNITNENELIFTMDYIYNNQPFFTRSTITSFENTFYSFFRDRPEYIFGFLDKSRFNNNENYTTLVSNMSNVFSSYDTNTMFINIKSDDNNNLIAYTYTVGKTNTEKINLANTTKFRELNNKFISAKNERDRIISLLNIDREFNNKILKDDIDKASRIFITSQNFNTMKIPFAYLASFSNKNVVKVKEFKFDNNNVDTIPSNIKLITDGDNNFYDKLDKSLVSSINSLGNNKTSNLIYYAREGTTNTARDVKVDSFVSAITDREFITYMFDTTSKNKIIYSLKIEDSGDYYKTLRVLFNDFNKGVNYSFANMRNLYSNYKILPYVKGSDESIYSKYSHTLFDYILPSLPR